MINLAEEALDYIGACGYGVEDVKCVRARGLNDGVLYGVDFKKFIDMASGIDYDEQDESRVHISRDLAILMNDGSEFAREVDAMKKFEWFKWHSASEGSWQDKSELVMAEPDEVEISLD